MMPENKPFSQPTTETSSKNNSYKGLSVPVIELPKGGGAVKSIDEKFSVNAANGTSSFHFPLPFSPFMGIVPDLALSYNSGAGNGLFGMGWSLSLPSIRRKTEKELPRYLDAIHSDTYIFSQAEDLVPVLERSGSDWKYTGLPNPTYIIHLYRPRIEGLFARIERWTKKSDGIIHWRVISRDNVTTVFGKNSASRIADPDDARRIFEWLPEFVYNDKGYCAAYDYRTEDGINMDPSLSHERNRVNGLSKFTNTCLKRIRYGNVQMYTPSMGDRLPSDFLFEAVFDYGEHSPLSPPFAETGAWKYRPDAFSDYHAGFEVRICRLCERVLFYHHIKELPGASALVRSVRFTYDNNGIDGFTFLKAMTETGYIKNDDGTYSQKSLPPFSFNYQQHEWNFSVKEIAPENLLHAPAGIDEPQYQWADLYSEGLSGILTEQGQGLFYKSNLGNGNFSAAKLITPRPSFTGLGHELQLQELEGNGIKQLVKLGGEPKGFFELDQGGHWQNFNVLARMPNIDFRDAHVKQLDLNGDGLPDLLISEDEVFTWYASEGKKGYGPPSRSRRAQDEEKGPAVVFADETQSVFLADMNGDGLTDIARIRNGEVCYWPNLGFGRFGAKVNMDNAPLFDSPDQFNPVFIRLADIDGSGTPDIVYLGKNRCTVWINRQGNSFHTTPVVISTFPGIDNTSQVSLLDLLGNGVNCIVWNAAMPRYAASPLKYIDLMNGKKPHVMTGYKNNMGKEVWMEYCPSTHYYLADQQKGNPWITKLPFPVQCVSKTIVYDRIRKTRFASEYSYHHGYYDSWEREFRGFGRVDQTDAETIVNFVHNSGGMANNTVQEDLHQQPVLTRSWFHTGAFLDRKKILSQFAEEYFSNTFYAEYSMPEPRLDTLADDNDWREALRACKGTLLRKEVYALDKNGNRGTPYLAEQNNVMVKFIQEKAINKHSIFFVHESEAITYQYELNPADPRVIHRFSIEIDPYGNLVRSATVAYGRTGTDTALAKEQQEEQAKQYVSCGWNSFTNPITAAADDYRTPLPWQVRSYEITGIEAPASPPYFSFSEIEAATDPAKGTNLQYHETATTGLQRRLMEWERTKYRDDDGITALKYSELKAKALVHEKYKASFTDALLDTIFTGKTTATALSSQLTSATAEGGGYIREDGYYWIPSGQQNYDTGAFFLSTEYTDPFTKKSTLEYDKYHLFVSKVTDPVQNTAAVLQYSYRVLQPVRMTDANENITAVRFDELGMVTATFSVGKSTDKGDVFDDTTNEASAADRSGTTFTYHIFEWFDQANTPGFDPELFYTPRPNYAYAKIWEVHYRALPARSTQYHQSYAYFDGSGKTILTKTQAEPGAALHVKADGAVETVDTTPSNRWLGNGRVILNNKGNPVKEYEPYFSIDPGFDDEKEMVELGVTRVLHYDPLDRRVKVDHPNGAFATVSFTAWSQVNYDENDTIADSSWNSTMLAYLQSLPETTAALKKRKLYRVDRHKAANTNAGAHADTPSRTYVDALGRTFLSVGDNKTEKAVTRTVYDIEGNVRTVKDTIDGTVWRNVMQYDYDMAGNKFFENSMDAGKRWSLNDAAGHPLLGYDDRGFVVGFKYDDARRPVDVFVTDGMVKSTVEHLEYGEGVTDDKKYNLRGKLYRRYDQAGLSTNTAFDFKGNLLAGSHTFCKKYDATISWENPLLVTMEKEEFINSVEYDALNRPVSIITPHTPAIPANEIIPGYNAAGLLDRLSVKLRGAASLTEFVTDINYNSKRQRETIYYKNGTRTRYEYDPFTFHLTALQTNASPGVVLQDIVYTYDPAGNITAIRDDAQKEITYDGETTQPENRFLYDALYRLTWASGRKHIGQNVIGHSGASGNFRNHPFIPNPAIPGPDEANAFCNYTEEYVYDAAGNMQSQTHRASAFPWTRTFKYGVVTGDNKNNQLRETTIGKDTFSYDYDQHGNMKKLEQLPSVRWNYKDQLVHANLGGGGDAYYIYDSSGERVRKVIQDTVGRKQKERFYLGGFEIYREYTLTGDVDLERESLQIRDDKRMVALIETKTIDKGKPVAAPVMLQRYQYDNHLGSASLELDETAAMISYEEYYPFGTTSYQAGKGTKEVPLKRYRYTGKERDEESGLNYHSARYYAPWLCRWVSTDPIGIQDGLNVFAYTRNNPINLSDPNGHQSAGAVVNNSAQQPPPVTGDTSASRKEAEGLHDFIMSLGDSPSSNISYSDSQNAINRMTPGIIKDDFKAKVVNKKYDTPEFRDFKARVYMAHYLRALLDQHAKDRKNNVPFEEIFSAKGIGSKPTKSIGNGEIMLVEPAIAFLDMQKAAAKEKVNIYATSGYRDPDEDFKLWDKGFEENYMLAVQGVTIDKHEYKIKDLDYSQSALENVLVIRSANKAMPGFSNHTKGIAFDLGVGTQLPHKAWDPKVEKLWTETKQYQWLDKHANKFGFYRIKSEAWHWEYRGGYVPKKGK